MEKTEIPDEVIEKILDETINIHSFPTRKEQIIRYIRLYLALVKE